MRQINIEYIQKWVNISEEELMQRLVKDALGLMKEADENKQAFETNERLADPEYRRIVSKFWMQADYLRKYFTEDEIINAAAKYMSMRDLVTEQYRRGRSEGSGLSRCEFVRYEIKHKFTEQSRNGWYRDVYDEASVFLVPADYQSVNGKKAVSDLIMDKFPFLQEYKVDVYDLNESNDWIFVKIDDHSLYVPTSALFEKDADKIVKTHIDYWHNYGNGKYDERESDFIESKAVQQFLSMI